MASAKRYMQDTEVARHVAEWQENIQPRLDEEVVLVSFVRSRKNTDSLMRRWYLIVL